MTDEKVTFEFIEQNESNSAEAEEILESPAEVSKKETGSSSNSAAKTKKRKKTALDYAIELLIKIVITVAVVLILCIFVIGIHEYDDVSTLRSIVYICETVSDEPVSRHYRRLHRCGRDLGVYDDELVKTKCQQGRYRNYDDPFYQFTF